MNIINEYKQEINNLQKRNLSKKELNKEIMKLNININEAIIRFTKIASNKMK